MNVQLGTGMSQILHFSAFSPHVLAETLFSGYTSAMKRRFFAFSDCVKSSVPKHVKSQRTFDKA